MVAAPIGPVDGDSTTDSSSECHKLLNMPDGIRPQELCSVSYLRPVQECPTYTEYFKEGDDIPSQLCPLHRGTLKQQAKRAVESLFSGLGNRLKKFSAADRFSAAAPPGVAPASLNWLWRVVMTYYSATDLARSFRTVRQNTIQIANDIPESQYDYRPTPETRTVAQALAHIAGLPRWQHRLHGIEKKPSFSSEDYGRYMQDAGAFETTLKTKADILRALETEGQHFASWVESLSDDTLGETVGFPPPLQPSPRSRFEMILSVKEHEMHHRAQLILIERLLGIVPHLTRERDAQPWRRFLRAHASHVG
jgi:uncharacterized damage-inducible protein DinB